MDRLRASAPWAVARERTMEGPSTTLEALREQLDESERTRCVVQLVQAGAGPVDALLRAAAIDPRAFEEAMRASKTERAWQRLSGLAPGARVPPGWTVDRVARVLAHDPATHAVLTSGMQRMWYGPMDWTHEPLDLHLVWEGTAMQIRLHDEPGAYAALVEAGLGAGLPLPVAPVETIYDLGAHIGLVALRLHVLHPDATLVCVEPDPTNAALLRHNLAHNGVRARVIEAAVGTHDGEQPLRVHPRSSLLHGTAVGSGFGHQRTTSVRTIALPSLLRPEDGPFGVKLDVEGAEHALALEPGALFDAAWIAGELHVGDIGPPSQGMLAALRRVFEVQLGPARCTVGRDHALRVARDFVTTARRR